MNGESQWEDSCLQSACCLACIDSTEIRPIKLRGMHRQPQQPMQVPSSSRNGDHYQHHHQPQHSATTFESGSMREVVKLPEGEDLNEWVAVNSRHIYLMSLLRTNNDILLLSPRFLQSSLDALWNPAGSVHPPVVCSYDCRPKS